MKGQNIKEAESLNKFGDILNIYRRFAIRNKCIVAGSVKLQEDNGIYNSIAYLDSKGEPIGSYHKNHLTMKEINTHLVSGKGATAIQTDIGKLGGIICFDLNFEELRDEYSVKKPDILTFSSMFHGGIAQLYWAFACESFIVSSLCFKGGGIVDPFGRVLKQTDCYNKHAVVQINLDKAIIHLDNNFQKYPDILMKYGDKVILDTPENIGSTLVYSLHPSIRALDIVKEFNLELRSDYINRMRLINKK